MSACPHVLGADMALEIAGICEHLESATEIKHVNNIYTYVFISSHCIRSVNVSNFIENKPSEYLKQIKPVCPVHNLRAGYAVPYHSFHTQSACHCHVTSGDE